MGLVYLLVWSQNRRSWANLCFFLTVIGVLGLAFGEMATMHAESPEAFGRAVRWTHFVYAIGFVGSLGFIHFYFGTGRRWLLALAIGLRLLVVLANFHHGSKRALHCHPQPAENHLPWRASIRARRVGAESVDATRAVIFVGAVCLCGGCLHPIVAHGFARIAKSRGGSGRSVCDFHRHSPWGSPGSSRRALLRMPFILSFPFLGVVLAMGYELSKDLLRAAHVSRELRESEQRHGSGHRGCAIGHLVSWLTTKRNLGERQMARVVWLHEI